MPPRRQSHGRGHLYQASGKWYLRYREESLDGSRKQVSSPPLATTAEVRTKTQARQLADEYLDDLKRRAPTSLGTTKIGDFIDTVYLPWIATQREPSTHDGYRRQWLNHFKSRIASTRLRDFQTATGERLLQTIATEDRGPEGNPLSHTTLTRLKTFLSGVFSHAIRQGYLQGHNPITEVSIPRGSDSRDTHAYTLDQELTMLTVSSGRLQLAVAIASFSGLSLSEMRGLRWEDYHDNALHVTRKMWHSHVGPTKTKKRRAPVPVIPKLAQYLDMWRKDEGWILANEAGAPLNIIWLARTTLTDSLKAVGLEWHGWHAFRRGLATNLDRLGVPDTTIQAILRHGSVNVTRASYIKSVREDVTAAMQTFNQAIEQKGRVQ